MVIYSAAVQQSPWDVRMSPVSCLQVKIISDRPHEHYPVVQLNDPRHVVSRC